jgi:hypothetical protein
MNHEERILRCVGGYLPLCPELMRVIGGFVGRHPLAELIATMPEMTSRVIDVDKPRPVRVLGEPRQVEFLDISVFDYIRSFPQKYDIGYNPTFVWHLIGFRVLNHHNCNKNACMQRSFPCNGDACMQRIYNEYRSDMFKMREWIELHGLDTCSRI